MADQTSRHVSFSYEPTGDLEGYIDVFNHLWQYSYSSTHDLLDIKNPENLVILHNQYDDQRRVTHQEMGSGSDTEVIDVVYHPDQTTTITDGNHHDITHTYDNTGVLVGQSNASGKSDATSYDTNFRTTSVTDKNGNKTKMGWSANGVNLTQIVSPSGATTQFTSDTLNNLIGLKDPQGNQTTYSYDQTRLTSTADAAGNLTTYTYTTVADAPQPAGMVKTITDPLGHQTLSRMMSLAKASRCKMRWVM